MSDGKNKSRAEQLLAELDCHVTIDQRADALKAIEAYLVDAYEAGAAIGVGAALAKISISGEALRRWSIDYATRAVQ